jgi:hypothetical protein
MMSILMERAMALTTGGSLKFARSVVRNNQREASSHNVLPDFVPFERFVSGRKRRASRTANFLIKGLPTKEPRVP